MQKRNLYTLLLVFSIILPGQHAGADVYGSGWYGETQLSVVYRNNLSRSWKSDDIVSDTISMLSIGGGHSRKLGTTSQVVFTGYLSWNRHDDFEDLDSLAASLGVSWVFQPNPGFANVWYNASAEVTRMEYRDSEVREGYLLDVEVGLSKRLGLRTTGHMGIRYNDLVFLEKSSEEDTRAAAFDTSSGEIYLGANHRLAERLSVFTEYGYRYGDLTASASGIPDPDNPYRAETEDPAFDHCEWPNCIPRYTYRLVGHMHKLELGFALKFDELGLDLSGRYYDVKGREAGTRYEDWSIQLGVIWNF